MPVTDIPVTSGVVSSPQPVPSTPALISIHSDMHLWAVLDPEMARTNPVEDKHRRLVRSHRSGPLDRDLKPNARIRDELNVVSCPLHIDMLLNHSFRAS